jgi:uncharacterized protein
MSPPTKTIGLFLLVAFGGAWSVWAAAWFLGVFNASPTGQVVVAVGAFSPALATVVMRRWVTRESFGDAGLRINLRGGLPYYVLGWLLPLPVIAVVVGLASALRLPFTHGDLPATAVLTSVVAAVLVTPLFLGEELGWRGYLQIRLFAQRPVLAAAVTGLVWGFFHFPVIVAGVQGYENVALGLATFPVFTVLLSIILGWLRERTGSIWAACLAHSASNLIGGPLSAYLFVESGSFILTSYTGVLAWIPLGALCAWIVLTGRLVPVGELPSAQTPDASVVGPSIANP